ncbi:hypothetical protein B0O99DRAFT_530828, partial [Bisporella sp. PMI_857]
ENNKIARLNKFDKKRSKFKTFLIQLEIYFKFNKNKFATYKSNVLFAVFYFKKKAIK